MTRTSTMRLTSDSPEYPALLKSLPGGPSTYRAFTAIGNLSILQSPTLAFFCSVRCPGKLIVETYDLARALRDAGTPVIAGFHTPMEKECLDLLLRGNQPIIICPARSIDAMRVPSQLKPAIAGNRLLIMSPFHSKHRRQTAELAQERNRFVVALATAIFVTHAAQSGKTEALCREVIETGKPLFTFDSPDNANLIALGAVPVSIADFLSRWPAAAREPGEP